MQKTGNRTGCRSKGPHGVMPTAEAHTHVPSSMDICRAELPRQGFCMLRLEELLRLWLFRT